VSHDGGVLSDIVTYLACPVCGADLAVGRGSVSCARNHSFDIARQGYANLLSGGAQAGTADTAVMVEARAAFLTEGHFAPLAALLAEHSAAGAAGIDSTGLIVDAGAGTGYYLSAVLDSCPDAAGAALDVSKFAARKAARAHPRIGAVVADLWRSLPLRSGAADVILNVFAPRNPAEFRRVLRPGGVLLVVTPTTRHLREVVLPLQLLSVDEDKTHQVDVLLGEHFGLDGREEHDDDLLLSHAAVETLVRMGPSAWHRSAADVRRRLADFAAPVPVTASFTVSIYRPAIDLP
jgi:23S rRNA (guanine745-N1)-methyltransferase